MGAIVDYLFYGTWTFVPWNFIRSNIVENISIFYGSHPWHWYWTQGIFVVGSTHVFLALLGLKTCKEKHLFYLVPWTLLVYSFLAHKEFRFILPILPILFIYSGVYLSTQSPTRLKYLVLLTLVLNGLLGTYLSLFHQRGVVDVMYWFRGQLNHPHHAVSACQHISSILFLTPCHSTPLQSILHTPLPIRFLTCEPPLQYV
jgi:phosphatidylinositol glycan class B